MVEYYPNKVCACGCGGCIVIRKQHSFPSVGIPKFMPFHYFRGYKHPLYGKARSEETCKKISLAKLGSKHTAATCHRISAAHVGLFSGSKHPMFGKENKWGRHTEDTKNAYFRGSNNPFYGKKHTQETVQKISKALTGKYSGKNHPLFGTHCSEETKFKISNALKGKFCGPLNHAYGKHLGCDTKEKLRLANLGKRHAEETKQKLSAALLGKYTGSKSSGWRGGISFEPYSPEFNSSLKRRIRKRDSYACKICGTTEKQEGRNLSVHHIDYDKNNNKPENLISLCCSCHSKTNVKREYWIKYFQSVSFSSLLIRTILPNGAVEESAPSGVTHQIVE